MLESINTNNDIRTNYNNLLNNIQETTANLVGKIKRKNNNNWVTNDTITGTSSDQRHPHFIGRLYRSKGKKFIGFSSLPNKRIIVWRKERGRRILC